MSDAQPTQTELFAVAELPGRPMLHWHGKRPLREIPYYPAQLRERYGEGNPPDGWVNRLYWGDNLQVMAHLMREFRGRITDTPARRDALVRGEYTWEAGEHSEGRVAVKIVDVLDEQWFGVVEA